MREGQDRRDQQTGDQEEDYLSCTEWTFNV